MFDDLDDILSDDSLFEGLELDSKLFDSKRYKRTVSVKTKSHQRKSMGNHFSYYKNLFSTKFIQCMKMVLKTLFGFLV